MSDLAVRVNKRHGERVRSILYKNRLLNRELHITEENSELLIPIISEIPGNIADKLADYNAEIISLSSLRTRAIRKEPFESIRERSKLNEDLLELLPRKWELLGDILILKLPWELEDEREVVAKTYAGVLGAKTVLAERSGISGVTRKPDLELIYGTDTETVHVENNIKFKLDVKELMFSSGNISERLRMAEFDCDGETIVDMFAGIGYFTLPLAVFANPAKIIACEINPVSFKYLNTNIELNGVEGIVEPILGDCRDTAPARCADRIMMGLIKNTIVFLPKALSVMKEKGGIIHYHDTCPDKDVPDGPLLTIRSVCETAGFQVELLKVVKIKSYAPGILHIDLDLRLIH